MSDYHVLNAAGVNLKELFRADEPGWRLAALFIVTLPFIVPFLPSFITAIELWIK